MASLSVPGTSSQIYDSIIEVEIIDAYIDDDGPVQGLVDAYSSYDNF